MEFYGWKTRQEPQKSDLRTSERSFQWTFNPREEKLLQHYAGIQEISILLLDTFLPNNLV